MFDPNTLPKKKCKFCNNFIKYKRSRDRDRKFCSKKCSNLFSTTAYKITCKCKVCSTKFETIKSKKRKYCSSKCAAVSQRKDHDRICQRCGKQFYLKRIAARGRLHGKYCSFECLNRKYEFDENFFEKIDTEERAYWLGFLFSDGNIYRNSMQVRISKRDKKHLLKFKSAMKSQHKIYNSNNCVLFTITSKKLYSSLINVELTPNKSLSVDFPTKLPKNLIRHFIRGVFDGDGCIYVHPTRKYSRWNIYSASIKFSNSLQELLMSELKVKVNKPFHGKVYNVNSGSQEGIRNMFNYLYNDATVFMERKYKKFIKALRRDPQFSS